MTNREKYFLKRDEYDTMMAISFRMHKNCPIEVIGAESQNECRVFMAWHRQTVMNASRTGSTRKPTSRDLSGRTR